MIKITTDGFSLTIDDENLPTLKAYGAEMTRKALSVIWGVDASDLLRYQAIFFDKEIESLSETDSFISLCAIPHGYVADAQEFIDADEARKQIEIDLEIINRESQWQPEESIYFDEWWPIPRIDMTTKILDFGVSLKDYNQTVFNRTLNRIILTRYGHISLNYSLSEVAIASGNPLAYYQSKIDEITSAIRILEGYRYQDINEDSDMPSRSRLVNLILSSEIF